MEFSKYLSCREDLEAKLKELTNIGPDKINQTIESRYSFIEWIIRVRINELLGLIQFINTNHETKIDILEGLSREINCFNYNDKSTALNERCEAIEPVNLFWSLFEDAIPVKTKTREGEIISNGMKLMKLNPTHRRGYFQLDYILDHVGGL